MINKNRHANYSLTIRIKTKTVFFLLFIKTTKECFMKKKLNRITFEQNLKTGFAEKNTFITQ
jgi:hypothetical protein